MKCEKCGMELQTWGEFCPGCGAKLSATTKTLDTFEAGGEKTVEVGKGALRFTGKAFSKVGEAAQKAGKKEKKEGE